MYVLSFKQFIAFRKHLPFCQYSLSIYFLPITQSSRKAHLANSWLAFHLPFNRNLSAVRFSTIYKALSSLLPSGNVCLFLNSICQYCCKYFMFSADYAEFAQNSFGKRLVDISLAIRLVNIWLAFHLPFDWHISVVRFSFGAESVWDNYSTRGVSRICTACLTFDFVL